VMKTLCWGKEARHKNTYQARELTWSSKFGKTNPWWLCLGKRHEGKLWGVGKVPFLYLDCCYMQYSFSGNSFSIIHAPRIFAPFGTALFSTIVLKARIHQYDGLQVCVIQMTLSIFFICLFLCIHVLDHFLSTYF
jgi:hypothetical protein